MHVTTPKILFFKFLTDEILETVPNEYLDYSNPTEEIPEPQIQAPPVEEEKRSQKPVQRFSDLYINSKRAEFEQNRPSQKAPEKEDKSHNYMQRKTYINKFGDEVDVPE